MAITYQLTSEKEIQDRVRSKHWIDVTELKRLGFAELGFFAETVQALGFSPLGLSGFLGTLIALFNEITKVERNLSVSLFNMILSDRESATYAAPFGLGVKFYTGFTDGSCIISANFESPAINDEQAKLYKFAVSRTLEATWKDHQAWVKKLTLEGKELIYHLSFEGFLDLTRREDSYMLKHKVALRTNMSDLVSMILTAIITPSLFAGAALMFWFFPRLAHELYPACWFVRNVNSPSLVQVLLIIVGCFSLAWLVARIQKKTFTVDGIGTKFLGQSASPDSRGYISTKWLVVVFLPVLPVRSYQIIEDYPSGQQNTRGSINPLQELHWEQIKETIWKSKWGYLIFGLLLFGFGVWSFSECL